MAEERRPKLRFPLIGAFASNLFVKNVFWLGSAGRLIWRSSGRWWN